MSLTEQYLAQTHRVYNKVREFQEFFRVPIRSFADSSNEIAMFRADLHDEEFKEWNTAEFEEDLLDALCDMAYIATGSMLSLGIKPRNNPIDNLINAQARLILELRKQVLCEKELTRNLNGLMTGIFIEAEKNGYNFHGAFDAVHAANMEKIWSREDIDSPSMPHEDRKIYPCLGGWIVKRADGKILKPPGWTAPELGAFV